MNMQKNFTSKVNNTCSNFQSSQDPLSLAFHHTPPPTKNIFQTGYSLIELLVVIAIIGIITAFAIPSYNSFTKNGEISEALTTLMNLTVQMEKRFIDLGSYNCGISIPTGGAYGFACTLDDDYTLTATSSDSNYKYSIIQTGARETNKFDGSTPSGTSTCWQVSEGGTCF